ncbi:chromosomal replication initiator protein DnaA [Gordonia araii NBRC 100433]|uniref:Chromosomal replication initiator protein DnaA n=1 Tax=Gordonia araii NBRC 100433 TaxID=1073574 RepID=G7H7A4_9ACTN|nr:chromosomal replication initiator protein DnaA [Gordonia araii]NNG99023.1 chromosomal replication initiator protein DnaA [Gordonia araii NBRC 100433]GAB11729.1 chromosomal replication initiator protein DnaA [Gordonia araii NBRC 100433]
MTFTGESFPDVWMTIVDELNDDTRVNPPLTRQQKAWLSLVQPLTLTEGFALLSVPNRVVQEQIERNLRDVICNALSRQLGQSVDLGVRIQPLTPIDTDAVASDPGAGESSADDEEEPADEPADDDWKSRRRHFGGRDDNGDWSDSFSPGAESTASSSGNLHPRYTFDTFVIGASNRFAHASAVAVAEAPARAYNPLFIWGESGLGKTHLLHAAGHYALRLFPQMRVKYVSTEEFTNDFINSLRDDRRVQFQRRYRDEVDILLVDDIQFLMGREGTQEEFFHTFNTLHNADRQIIISSDRPPHQLATLEDRLRTRFEGGLITDVQPPDLETRVAILRKKAQMDKIDVPDDVLVLIASHIERNIRELEGALIRVTAYASLTNTELTRSQAEIVLRNLLPESGALEVSAPRIIAVTSDYFSVSIDQLTGPSRKQEIVTPRQIAMYLCRELTDLSLPKIGEAFNRDHSTVMHAERKVRKDMTKQREIYDHVQELTARIKRSPGPP